MGLMNISGDENEMLSRDCDGCTSLQACNKRYQRAHKGEKVYCPDGTAHLIDSASISNPEIVCLIEA
jgi:hypothetical protein